MLSNYDLYLQKWPDGNVESIGHIPENLFTRSDCIALIQRTAISPGQYLFLKSALSDDVSHEELPSAADFGITLTDNRIAFVSMLNEATFDIMEWCNEDIQQYVHTLHDASHREIKKWQIDQEHTDFVELSGWTTVGECRIHLRIAWPEQRHFHKMVDLPLPFPFNGSIKLAIDIPDNETAQKIIRALREFHCQLSKEV